MAAASAAAVEGDVSMEDEDDGGAVADAAARVLLQRKDAWNIEPGHDDCEPDVVAKDASIVLAEWVTSPKSTRFSMCEVAGCLDLSSCGLRSLPRALFSLRGVTHLHLTDNKNLSCIDGIGQLHELVLLEMDQCALSAIPDEIGQLRMLEYVNFSENPEITKMPDSLAECKALVMLYVNGCDNLVSLPEALGTCGRPLTIVCSYCPRIFISAATLMSAEVFIASECELPAHSLIDIATMVRRNLNPKLHTISVVNSRTEATKEVVSAFEHALRSNSSLKYLEGVASARISAALARNCRGDPAPDPYVPLVKAAR